MGPLLPLQAPARGQDSLTLITENNPPFTFPDPSSNGAIGPAVDIVTALMEQAGISFEVQLQPWRRAYRAAQTNADTCLFLAYRTPERERLFSWVGPLIVGEWAIFKRTDSDIEISALSELQNYAVVGMAGSADALALEKALRKNILQAGSGELAAQMLYRGRADLWISETIGGIVSAKAVGLPTPKVAFHWKTSDLSLACSKKTSPVLIDKLDQANRDLEDLKNDLINRLVSQ